MTVTTNPDGTAQRIDATSTGGGLTPLTWLLPLLLLPLLGLLFWLVKKRGRNDFILERDAAAGPGGDPNAGGRS